MRLDVCPVDMSDHIVELESRICGERAWRQSRDGRVAEIVFYRDSPSLVDVFLGLREGRLFQLLFSLPKFS